MYAKDLNIQTYISQEGSGMSRKAPDKLPAHCSTFPDPGVGVYHELPKSSAFKGPGPYKS